jgi:hypothetical protein
VIELKRGFSPIVAEFLPYCETPHIREIFFAALQKNLICSARNPHIGSYTLSRSMRKNRHAGEGRLCQFLGAR